jgi:hypothetical protein
MESALTEKDVWSVVLAGGDAERLRPFVLDGSGDTSPNSIALASEPVPCFKIWWTGPTELLLPSSASP